MRQGICVQAGLYTHAEFSFLVTRDDWQASFHEGNYGLESSLLPLFDDIESWKYYGVDQDVGSINRMLLEYGNRDRIEWVAASLNYLPSAFRKLTRWAVSANGNHPHYYGLTCTFDKLIDDLGLENLDILCIDIEDNGENVFWDYSWRLKPRLIMIELHGIDDKSPFVMPANTMRYLDKQGYEKFMDREPGGDRYTNAGFLLRD